MWALVRIGAGTAHVMNGDLDAAAAQLRHPGYHRRGRSRHLWRWPLSPLPLRMEDHWKLEPGTDPARARLMWLIRTGGYEPVAELARQGQERLAGLAGLDLVPRQWLHITTLIAGYADQITPGQVDAMIADATRQATHLRPVTVTLGRVLALGRHLPDRDATITSISLVSQTPQQRWTWDLISDVPLEDARHAVS